MKRKTICIGILFLLLLASLGTASTLNINNLEPKDDYSNSVTVIPGEVLVMFEENAEPSGSFSSFLVNDYGGISVNTYENGDLVKVTVKKGAEQSFIENIKNDARVKYAMPNFAFSCSETIPDDTRYDEQWGLEKIKCPRAWDITTGDRNIKIAIIDTGMDYDHTDLDANCGSSDYDYVDINTSAYEDMGYTLVGGEDYTGWDGDPMDHADAGHGTLCAGIAGAVGDNGGGITGVNWDCYIVPLRAGFVIKDPNDRENNLMDPVACYYALRDAVDVYGADVISMSWSFSGDGFDQDAIDIFEDIIDEAWNDGAVLVASTGNDYRSPCNYPARFDNVIGVGAIDRDGKRRESSNYGTGLSLMAPGEDIISTEAGGGYGSHSGTSFACPLVAGVAALAIDRYPSYTNEEIRDLLEDTADETGNGDSEEYGNGLVDAVLLNDDTPPNVEIIKPQYAIYINDLKLLDCTNSQIIAFLGPLHVTVDASDDESGIEKVEFYLNNKLKKTDKEAPYKWHWNEPGTGGLANRLKVKAYNNEGKNEYDEKKIDFYYIPSGSFNNEYINDNGILTNKTLQGSKYKREFTAEIPNSEDLGITDLEEHGISISFTYDFDFGDGATETAENVKDPSYSVEHTYAKKGTYEVSTELTANIDINMDCEYDGHHISGLTAQQTVEISGGNSVNHPFFNILERHGFGNLFSLFQKIFSIISL